MAGLSVCMIVKNEERVIARALESVRSVADEIIVADTGSTDATKRICERYTDKIYDFEWKDDFSAARNFSFAQATRPYIMWLDADDALSEQSVKALSDMMRSLDSEPHDAVMCRYVTARDESGRPTFSYYRERIVRKAAEPVWTGFVHECMRPFADAVYSDDIVIDHYRPGGRDPRRNLNIYQKKIAEGVRLDGRGKYYYGRELYYNKLYLEAACVLEDYLAGTDKWYVNAVEACSVLADCKLAMGDTDGSVAALCRSFCYAPPRAEAVCKLGGLFRKRDDEQAAFWYLSALSCKAGTQGFTEPDCLDFIPYIELCGCYYRLGDVARAKKYHELAKAIKPDHPSVIYNERFFADK